MIWPKDNPDGELVVKADPVNHPAHYISETGIEFIDVIEAFGLGFCLGNTVKYVLRCGRKDPSKTIEDLQKARWYLDREIHRRQIAQGCA